MKENPTQAPFFVDTEVITLTRNGLWLSDGIEIDHEGTRRLFSKRLARDDRGYFLRVGTETKRITVEDTPYFIVRIDGSPESGFSLLLNDETREKLDPSTLSYRPGRLACRLQRGEEAKFLSAPYFDLLKNLEQDAQSYFVLIEGIKIPLARS